MDCNRKSLRLKDYDYTQNGAYYVTICAHNRRCVFGNVRSGEMMLNDAGTMTEEWWKKLPDRFPGIEMDEFIVMPNHLHGIINIVGAPFMGALNEDRATIKVAPTLGQLIGAFKSITTNEYIRNVKTNNWPSFNRQFWQRNYYEHVIRNESDLNCIREYIVINPTKWEQDEYYVQ